MKINNLKINGFGNLESKEIVLEKGINLIYGKNESGKSTLLKFLNNMFYGTSKNKKGREISDYEKYKPWKANDFSGKISYELDNGEKYEVYREFGKKNPKIFNEKLEDISKEFTVDKTKGIDFFYEQTHIDEELFLSSVMVMQQEVKLNKTEQNSLVQKIANLATSGNDSISYEKCMDKIARKQLVEIGTSRSQDRPINKIMQKKEELNWEKEKLENNKNRKRQIENNKEILEKQIEELNNKINILKEINALKEKERIEEERIKINEEIKNKQEEKIEELNNKIEQIKKEKNKNEIKKINNKIYSIIFILNIILIGVSILLKNKIIQYSFIALLPILLIVYFLHKNKINKNNKFILDEINDKIKEMKNEIYLIEKNEKEKIEEINILKNNLETNKNVEIEKIKNSYKNKINLEEIMQLIQQNNYFRLEENQNKLNNKKIEFNTLELEEKNINMQLDTLAKIEEELEELKEEEQELKEKNEAIEFAKRILEDSYKEMRENVTPKFANMLSETIKKISGGKYQKVKLNREEGIIVEREDGNYISADLLSTGTIDQMYLSLRLASMNELAKERMPIILDESFAYFDDNRLANILKYMKETIQAQIIILTCSHREEKIMQDLQVPFTKIEL